MKLSLDILGRLKEKKKKTKQYQRGFEKQSTKIKTQKKVIQIRVGDIIGKLDYELKEKHRCTEKEMEGKIESLKHKVQQKF